MKNGESELNATPQTDPGQQIYETLIWRGDIIPTTEAGVALAEEGERFRECREGKAQTIANRERYEDRERCHAASDGEREAPQMPQKNKANPISTRFGYK